MNLFTRNSPYYHLLKYLLFLLKHPVYLLFLLKRPVYLLFLLKHPVYLLFLLKHPVYLLLLLKHPVYLLFLLKHSVYLESVFHISCHIRSKCRKTCGPPEDGQDLRPKHVGAIINKREHCDETSWREVLYKLENVRRA